jgi:hypothetical protein
MARPYRNPANFPVFRARNQLRAYGRASSAGILPDVDL